jgi:hypothetical protein
VRRRVAPRVRHMPALPRRARPRRRRLMWRQLDMNSCVLQRSYLARSTSLDSSGNGSVSKDRAFYGGNRVLLCFPFRGSTGERSDGYN